MTSGRERKQTQANEQKVSLHRVITLRTSFSEGEGRWGKASEEKEKNHDTT